MVQGMGGVEKGGPGFRKFRRNSSEAASTVFVFVVFVVSRSGPKPGCRDRPESRCGAARVRIAGGADLGRIVTK